MSEAAPTKPPPHHRTNHMRFDTLPRYPRLLLLGIGLTTAFSGCRGAPPARKVLLIGLDGIRVDILAEAHTPNIDRLIANGFFSDRAQTKVRTVSGPGWSSMLIGARTDKPKSIFDHPSDPSLGAGKFSRIYRRVRRCGVKTAPRSGSRRRCHGRGPCAAPGNKIETPPRVGGGDGGAARERPVVPRPPEHVRHLVRSSGQRLQNRLFHWLQALGRRRLLCAGPRSYFKSAAPYYIDRFKKKTDIPTWRSHWFSRGARGSGRNQEFIPFKLSADDCIIMVNI